MARFAFRVNGNKDIGMGHVMRCLSLAPFLEEQPVFIINDNPTVFEKVKKTGYLPIPIRTLQDKDFQVMINTLNNYPRTSVKKMPSEDQELEVMCAILKREKIDVLITDLVFASKEYFKVLKQQGIVLISLDELGESHFSSDLVFNCNSVSKTKKYLKEDCTKIYIGSEYALLRKEFSGVETRSVRDQVKRILVTCGGTDMKGLSLKILRALQPFSKDLEIVLIIGPDFKFRESLNGLLKEMQNIFVKEDVKEMHLEMMQADLAIASGGTTMYELAACGTPSIILCQYEHQNEFASVLEEQGVLVNLGIGESVEEGAIREAVHSLLDSKTRQTMSGTGQSIIDGNGAQRVAHIIQEALH